MSKRKKKRKDQPETPRFLNPRLITPGPGEGFITIDFRHHPDCPCRDCREQAKSGSRRKQRNGSR